MWALKILAGAAVAYLAVIAILYAAQTWMLFPTRMVASHGQALPATAIRLTVETSGGERLHGVRLPAARPRTGEKLLVLGFGGNAWNADSVAAYLHELFPEADIVAFHYRGYAPSTGRPSAAALLADAPLVHDAVTESGGPARVVAVGFSIGAGVAADLASHRPLAGLILVTPFDSLEAVARELYPWAPVRWLLRHRMPTIDFMRGLATPTALIAAERDTIVPPHRTHALRPAIANLVLDRTIAGAGHNDLYHQPAFRQAMVDALARVLAEPGGGAAEPGTSPRR